MGLEFDDVIVSGGGGAVDTPHYDEPNKIIYLNAPIKTSGVSTGNYGGKFDPGNDDMAFFVIRVPPAFDGKKLKCSVIWLPDSTNALDCYWKIHQDWSSIGNAINTNNEDIRELKKRGINRSEFFRQTIQYLKKGKINYNYFSENAKDKK